MTLSIGMVLRVSGGLAAALCLSACATGQGSFVAGSGGSGGDQEALFEDAPLDEAAPGLVAASGNALLPGVRAASPAALAAGVPAVSGGQGLLGKGPVLLSTGPAAANLDASVNLLNGAPSAGLTTGLSTSLASANVSANLGGPLLALNGSRAALLGVGVTGPSILGAVPSLNAGLGGAINPATAATQTLISATANITQSPATPSQPTAPGQTPLLPPVLGVPGVTPLQTLLPLLTAPSTTPKPPLLPGLLGQ